MKIRPSPTMHQDVRRKLGAQASAADDLEGDLSKLSDMLDTHRDAPGADEVARLQTASRHVQAQLKTVWEDLDMRRKTGSADEAGLIGDASAEILAEGRHTREQMIRLIDTLQKQRSDHLTKH